MSAPGSGLNLKACPARRFDTPLAAIAAAMEAARAKAVRLAEAGDDDGADAAGNRACDLLMQFADQPAEDVEDIRLKVHELRRTLADGLKNIWDEPMIRTILQGLDRLEDGGAA